MPRRKNRRRHADQYYHGQIHGNPHNAGDCSPRRGRGSQYSQLVPSHHTRTKFCCRMLHRRLSLRPPAASAVVRLEHLPLARAGARSHYSYYFRACWASPIGKGTPRWLQEMDQSIDRLVPVQFQGRSRLTGTSIQWFPSQLREFVSRLAYRHYNRRKSI